MLLHATREKIKWYSGNEFGGHKATPVLIAGTPVKVMQTGRSVASNAASLQSFCYLFCRKKVIAALWGSDHPCRFLRRLASRQIHVFCFSASHLPVATHNDHEFGNDCHQIVGLRRKTLAHRS